MSGFASTSTVTLSSNKGIDEIAKKLSQKLLIMRHGERVDFTFGNWVPHCFDNTGKYIRKDLNMPASLPNRSLGPRGFLKDTPLTQVGIFQASLVGEALKESDINLEHIFCSPSFRCIQTCDAVLRALDSKQKIKVEPGLFESLASYSNGLPNWLEPEELIDAGYNIDINYVPIILQNDLLNSEETFKEYFQRSQLITKNILNFCPSGDVLFVAHATSLDICSRQLRTISSRILVEKVPYCSLIALWKNGETWDIMEPPSLPVTHCANDRFNWRILQF